MVPSEDWLRKNPVSNRAFTFQVDVTKVREYLFGRNTTKPAFVKVIETRTGRMQPIKGTTEQMDSTRCRVALRKMLVDSSHNQELLEEDGVTMKMQQEEMKTLKARMRVLEKQMKTTRIQNESHKMTKKILCGR